jgi:hypothetical protein
MYYNTSVNKLQDEKGYASIIVLIIILGVISILGFVVEAGRMLEINSRLTNGTHTAARGGAVQYGKTVSKVYKEEFELLIPTISPEVEAELFGATTEEIEKETNKRIKKNLQSKISEIKDKALGDCKSKVSLILNAYDLISETMECSETEVQVKASFNYSPVISGYSIGGKAFKSEAKQKVYINTNE